MTTKIEKFVQAYKKYHWSWDELMKMIDDFPDTPTGRNKALCCEGLMYEWMLRETGLEAEWWFSIYRPEIAMTPLSNYSKTDAKFAVERMLYWGRTVQDCWEVWAVMPDKECEFAQTFHKILLGIKNGKYEVVVGDGFSKFNGWNDKLIHSLKPKPSTNLMELKEVDENE